MYRHIHIIIYVYSVHIYKYYSIHRLYPLDLIQDTDTCMPSWFSELAMDPLATGT